HRGGLVALQERSRLGGGGRGQQGQPPPPGHAGGGPAPGGPGGGAGGGAGGGRGDRPPPPTSRAVTATRATRSRVRRVTMRMIISLTPSGHGLRARTSSLGRGGPAGSPGPDSPAVGLLTPPALAGGARTGGHGG